MMEILYDQCDIDDSFVNAYLLKLLETFSLIVLFWTLLDRATPLKINILNFGLILKLFLNRFGMKIR